VSGRSHSGEVYAAEQAGQRGGGAADEKGEAAVARQVLEVPVAVAGDQRLVGGIGLEVEVAAPEDVARAGEQHDSGSGDRAEPER
jgi:hypothetical protein